MATDTDAPDATLTPDQRDLNAAADEWKLSEAAYSDQRTNEVADLKFEAGEHFTDEELSWKKEHKKPAFVMDQTSGQVAKVTNQPVHRIIVTANGGGADPKSAEMWQGICRRIENLSNAEAVYRWARRHAVIMGRGFWRIRADYFSPLQPTADGSYDLSAFQQDIRIEPILNQHSVRPDPRSRLLDYSDRRFYIITDDLEWSEFARLHPKATHTTKQAMDRLFSGTGDCPPNWVTEKGVRVAERYYLEDTDVHLCVLKPGTPLANGSTALGPTVVVKDATSPGYTADQIVKEHTFKLPKVKWMKYTAAEVLERAAVPGRYIPVVQITGERRIIDGKEDARGMVRMAKDPQRLVDFYESRLAETVDLAAYDTWKAAAEAVEGHADDYVNAHIDRPGLLLWNHKDAEGQPIPEPEHVTVAPEIAGIAVAAQRAGMNLRGVLGVPDVTPDELKPEQSGKAIRARQAEQAQTTSHYGESTADGIRLTGRIILSMGRDVYDAPRILRINGIDEKPIDVVTFDGQKTTDEAVPRSYRAVAQGMATPPPGAPAQRQAEQVRHMLDISVGDFDVTVQAGKGYATGRQEAVDAVTAMVQAAPGIAPIAIPTILKNSDFPGAQELATKLEPPDPNSGMVPQEMIQKAQAAIDALQGEIAERDQQLDAQAAKAQATIAAAQLDAQTKVEIERIRIAGQIELEKLKGQIELEKAHIAAEQATRVAALQPRPEPSGIGVGA